MIKINGPISVYDFIKLSSTCPRQGYYTQSDIFGSKGDFVTSPEISQVFGELMALWYVSQWHSAGCPEKVRVIELGPGKGTLMSDMLRVWSKFPKLNSAVKQIDFLEASEPLARIQASKLAPDVSLGYLSPLADKSPSSEDCLLIENAAGITSEATGRSFRWYSYPDNLFHRENLVENTWTIIIAHEFFDALPIYKFKKTYQGWHEIMVDLDTSENSPLHFAFYESPVKTRATSLLQPYIDRSSYQQLLELELAPELIRIGNQVGQLLELGGAALIIDYGEDHPEGNTLRGIQKHQFCHPLSMPGRTDLSSNVNFSLIRESLGIPSLATHFTTQADFLLEMGIQERIQMLMKSYVSAHRGDEPKILAFKSVLESMYDRLTNPNQMGKLYKFMALTNGSAPVPGFK
ncbi:hypothetical protein DSO57_1035872 [Entomophthora muscae]|nr:hypothetical protein DSO57_1035872 [Entomophthora muscae]